MASAEPGYVQNIIFIFRFFFLYFNRKRSNVLPLVNFTGNIVSILSKLGQGRLEVNSSPCRKQQMTWARLLLNASNSEKIEANLVESSSTNRPPVLELTKRCRE